MLFGKFVYTIIVFKLLTLQFVQNNELKHLEVENKKNDRKIEEFHFKNLAKNLNFNENCGKDELIEDVKFSGRTGVNDNNYDGSLSDVEVADHDKVNFTELDNRKSFVDDEDEIVQRQEEVSELDGEIGKPFDDAISERKDEEDLRHKNVADQLIDYETFDKRKLRKRRDFAQNIPQFVIYEGQLPSPEFIKELARLKLLSDQKYAADEDAGTNVLCNPAKQIISMEANAPKCVKHIDRTVVEEIIQVDIPMTSERPTKQATIPRGTTSKTSRATKCLTHTTQYCRPTPPTRCSVYKTTMRTKIPYLFLKKY
ncbi:hypothetical protein O3M35_007189 [Rhynocoris fuscipes]|uniref:Uncharacterized protein n=1 Tax=Rhynocoris fuscipes TaxID=488301 RepID=A0AAW1D8G7_9HEMI